jgi:partitioning defective protein 3
VGATSESIPLSDGHHHLYQPHHLNNSSNNNMQSQLATTQLVVLPNEGGQPLGIHVVPDYSPLGNELGLLVQGVEPGGRIYRDGRIAVHDRIVEINSHPLKDVPFHRAQELFRNALQVYFFFSYHIFANLVCLSCFCFFPPPATFRKGRSGHLIL